MLYRFFALEDSRRRRCSCCRSAVNATVAGVVVIQDWRKIHLRSTGWLLAPTFLGIPLGIVLLTSAHQHFIKFLLAVIILAFFRIFADWKRNRPNCQRTAMRGCWVADSLRACSAAHTA